ncbi:MAG: HD domain-containing protein [Paludibacteraceae bacterium]
MIINDLVVYIETHILPLYDAFDHGHNRDHVCRVIAESLELADHYDVDVNQVYTIAAYHDAGLARGRDLHHIYSAELLLADRNLLRWFSPDDLCRMAEAVEDHRASGKHPPRSIYGAIVAEADRDLCTDIVLRRTIQFGLKRFPDQPFEFHLQRTIEHLHEKYAEGGYLKLWLHSPKNERGLADLRALIANPAELERRCRVIYENIDNRNEE